MSIGRVPGATGIQPSIVDAKGDLIVATAADSVDRLAVGSNNQTLLADSAQTTGVKWASSPQSLMTATGDLLYASAANTPARLAIGSTDQVLKVSGGIPAWGAAPAASFVGCSVKRYNVSTVLGANTGYTVSFTTEEYDTDGFHDNTTNNSRITVPAGKGGKYLFTGYVANALGTPGTYFELDIWKNGGTYTDSGLREGRVIRNAPKEYLAMAQVVNAAAGDYFELVYQQNNGETVNMFFSAQFVYLGA